MSKKMPPRPWITGKGGKAPREVGSAAMRIQYHNSMVLSAKIPLNLYSSSTMPRRQECNEVKYGPSAR